MTPALSRLTTRNLQTLVPSGFTASWKARLPSLWRKAISFGGYAAGCAIVALLLWQVGTILFGSGRYGSAGFETVTVISLPPYPGETSNASAAADTPPTSALAAAHEFQPVESIEAAVPEISSTDPAPIPALGTPERPTAPAALALDDATMPIAVAAVLRDTARAEPTPTLGAPTQSSDPSAIASDDAASQIPASPAVDGLEWDSEPSQLAAISETWLETRDQATADPMPYAGPIPGPAPLPAMLQPGKLTANPGISPVEPVPAAATPGADTVPVEPEQSTTDLALDAIPDETVPTAVEPAMDAVPIAPPPTTMDAVPVEPEQSTTDLALAGIPAEPVPTAVEPAVDVVPIASPPTSTEPALVENPDLPSQAAAESALDVISVGVAPVALEPTPDIAPAEPTPAAEEPAFDTVWVEPLRPGSETVWDTGPGDSTLTADDRSLAAIAAASDPTAAEQTLDVAAIEPTPTVADPAFDAILNEIAPTAAKQQVDAISGYPTPTTQVAALPTGLAVNRMIMTRGIENKEPIDSSYRFAAADGDVYAFASFRNQNSPTQVTFSWFRDDRLVTSTKLRIGQAASWRTWSRTGVAAGNWRVKITDEAGTVLAESAFTVN